MIKRYSCDFDNCDYSGYSKASIDNHTNANHLKLKPFKCEDCDKCFGKKYFKNTH